MQPTYFPWAGYFHLIAKSDKFVFLDDAQFNKGSWQTRNYIISNKKKYLLVVPTKKSITKTNILSKKVHHETNFQKKHSKIINTVYSRYPYINDLKQLIRYFEKLEHKNLSELNTKIIIYISNKLDLNTKFYYSSQFNFQEKRTEKTIRILNELKATEYLSPTGSKEYLIEDNFEDLTNIKLSFSKFKNNEYKQEKLEKFIGNLSIIDLIANLGWKNTKDYVNSNN